MPVTHQLKSIPAPTGGLNARDGVVDMPPTDAVELTNWIPDTGGVRCRKGYAEWAINFPGNAAVSTIMPYFGPGTGFPAGSFLTAPTTMPGKLFAATDTAIYDITSKTNAPTVAVALGGTALDGWFSHAIVSNAGGNFLLACSENRGYYTYDGTTWLQRVAGAGAGQINGVNPNNLVHVNVWKRRAWFVEKNTTKVWYLPVDAVAGTASMFDFGPLFKKGGHLAFTTSWTIDAGEGIDDFFVAVSSNGEVAIYKGTDPSTAATFALQGVWFIGQIPVGRRCYTPYGGDLLIVSTDGIVPLSEVTRGGSGLLTASNKEYSSKISMLVGEALRNSFTARGWHLTVATADRLMLCNIPDYDIYTDRQFALSTVVNQWCTLQGIPVRCYGSTGSYLFSGTDDGKVYLLFKDYLDAVAYDGTSSSLIAGKITTAFSSFDQPAQVKQFTMLRPVFVGARGVGTSTDVRVDYADLSYAQATPTPPVNLSAVWDSALWDSDLWGSDVRNTYADWVTVNAIGVAGAADIVTSSVADTTLSRIDYMYLPGGPL